MSPAKENTAKEDPAKEDWTGRTFEVEVGPVAHGGHFIARHEGRVLFVRHALPGERVVVSVYEDNGGSFCRADAVEVLEPSPDRVEPPCPFSGPGMCGGCDFQHVSWDAQRELKAQVVREQLARLAKIERDVVVEALPGGPLEWRTRIRMAVGRDGRPGFRGLRSHDVIPIDHCVISRPGMVEAVTDRKWRAQELTIVQDGDGNRHVGEVRGRHTTRRAGTGTAVETAAQRKWRISADGFWQVHPAAADTFATVVGEWAAAEPGQRAWDLYGGAGLFASVLGRQVGQTGSVLVVESFPGAVEDGRRNLRRMPQVEWVADKVEHAVTRRLPVENPHVVVLDPPRKGAGKVVVAEVARRRPERVVYVACDPAALARDLAEFTVQGYRLAELRAFDAFPMTHHMECIALLVPETS